jgi:transposase
MSGKEVSVKKYVVRLEESERSYLEGIICKGRDAASKLTKARILLKADISDSGEGWSDGRIFEALGTSLSTIFRVRQRFVEEGLEASLARKQRISPPVPPIFDGEKEAKLLQLACSKPPEGHSRWTLRLLEQKVVELGIVEAASDNTIGRVLKKTFLNHTLENNGSSHRRHLQLL